MTSMETKPLNRLEVWVAEHAVPIFAVIAVLILLGAGAVIFTYQKQSGIAERVKVIAPQVTRVNKAICDRQALDHTARAHRCAERIRVGLINCRHSEPCRAALLAAITYPPPARPTASLEPGATQGGGAQNPSHAGQQPGPGKGHHGEGNHGQGKGNGAVPPGQKAPSAPSPGAPGLEKPGGGPPLETPGNGPKSVSGAGSSSDAGVELCVLERTCVGLETGAFPKGLLP